MKLASHPRVCALLLLAAAALRAEDGSAPAEQTGSIKSDHWEYFERAGRVHYWGGVKLDAPGLLHLTCEDLVAMRAEGGRYSRIVATTNVAMVIVQLPSSTNTAGFPARPGSTVTNYAYGFQAVFSVTNNVVTLVGSPETGQPRVESADWTAVADSFEFDRGNERFSGLGHFTNTFKLSALKRQTNAAPALK